MFDIEHAYSSSNEVSTCSVEPGSAEDVGEIVRCPDLTHQYLPTRVLIATYPGFKPNAFCCERWRTYHESEIFLDERRTGSDVALQ
jgi:hypothetical protein